jgi:hypothetical protein
MRGIGAVVVVVVVGAVGPVVVDHGSQFKLQIEMV